MSVAPESRERMIEDNIPLVNYWVSRWFGRSHPLFDDLVSCGLTGLVKAVDTFNPDRGSLATHIRHQMRGEIANFRRLERKHQVVDFQPSPSDLSSEVEERPLAGYLAGLPAALSKLPDIQQRIIHLRFMEGRSLQSIADKLTMNIKSVWYHLSVGLGRLRTSLKGGANGHILAALRAPDRPANGCHIGSRRARRTSAGPLDRSTDRCQAVGPG